MLGVVIFGTYLAWLINKEPSTGIDDADIYLVYMRNLSEGHGFVFQPGGEQVEGFTSLLWTLIGAFGFMITDQIERFLLFLNVILIAVALWRLVLCINKLTGLTYVIAPGMVLLGSLVLVPGFFDWTVLSLMETGLWCALLIFTAINILDWDRVDRKGRLNHSFILLCSLLVLCRPESLLIVPVFMGIRLLQISQLKDKKVLLLKTILFPVLTMILLVIWRLSYFGFPFPNTYYAKVSSDLASNFSAGLEYLKLYFFEVNPLALLVYLACLIPLVKILIKPKQWRENYYLFSILALLNLFMPLYVGGDHFKLGRFMQGMFPILLAGTWLILVKNIQLQAWRQYGLAASLSALAMLMPERTMKASMDEQGHLKNEFFIAEKGRLNSQTLNNFFDQRETLPSQGVLMSGGTAYTYKGETIDLLGLNNVEMAHADKVKNKGVLKNHASFNQVVFFKQLPDLFWLDADFMSVSKFRYFEGLPADEFQSQVFQHVNRTEQFKELYQRVFIQKGTSDLGLVIYASRAFLESLEGTVYSVQILKDAPLDQ